MELQGFLEKMGLTEYEAKTLSTLFNLREAEAPDVSRAAQVPKTRVYDVLDKLIEKGLVIKIYARPQKFRVLELNDVLSKLLDAKKTEIKDLELKIEEMKDSISLGKEKDEAEEKVMKVKNKNDFYKILGQEIGKAKKEVIGFTDLESSHEFLEAALKKAAANKVEIKILSKIPTKISNAAKNLNENGVTVRDSDHGMHAYIIDGKKVILSLSDFQKQKPEYHFTIWNNHKGMADALHKHFHEHWSKSKELQ